jgi:hypothetical protein
VGEFSDILEILPAAMRAPAIADRIISVYLQRCGLRRNEASFY